MKYLRTRLVRVFIGFLLCFCSPPSQAETSTIQFFGDVFIPDGFDAQKSTNDPFTGVQSLLDESDINVINFEGVGSIANLAPIPKTWVLKMSPEISDLLKDANIHVATLANNHSLDFGPQGLFDSLVSLKQAGIQSTGAGLNLEEALRPVMIETHAGSVCILAFNRTYPSSFWATATNPGTASVSIDETISIVRRYIKICDFTFPVFHWGEELQTIPKDYQVMIAHALIDAGATAVLGHHPHVVQTIEFYKDKPILYSLGNFVFMTNPISRSPEGVAVKMNLNKWNKSIRDMSLTALAVKNLTKPGVMVKPLVPDNEADDPVYRSMDTAAKNLCRKGTQNGRWICRFTQPNIARK